MRILHCVTDDKFIDGAISLFESDKRYHNEYVLFSDLEVAEFQYIKSASVSKLSTSQFLYKCKEFNVIVLHSLYCIPVALISKIPMGIKVIWYAWGWDLYDGQKPLIPLKLYRAQTESVRKTLYIQNILIRCYSIYKACIMYKDKLKAIKRVDYFSGVFPYEYDLLKSIHKEFKAKPIDFYYGAVDFFIKDEIDDVVNNDMSNIIIGNSAHLTNNHIDVINALSKEDIKNIKKIIIPLSYGANVVYRDLVSEVASKTLSSPIVTLRDFVPLDDYLSLVSNCRAAIFGHERQQASDNIFMQLYFGARVFMSETSLAFNYLKSLGLHVYSIQSELHLVSISLSYNEIMNNRRILAKHYSRSSLVSRIKIINDILIKN